MYTENEKLAHQILGPDGSGIYISMGDSLQQNARKRDEERKYNKQVDEFNNRFENHIESLNSFAEELSANMDGLEIAPVGNYLIVEPMKTNPFQKVKMTESGIITDLGGLTPEYKSQEDGQYHEEEQMIGVGTVIESGIECKFVEPGDIVMYPNPLVTPIPFYNLGFVHLNENKVMCVINDKLTERKNKLKYGSIND